MRIVFMGTPELAVVSLKKLVEAGHDVCAVYTQPDRPKNRGMKLYPTPVKEYALAQGIPVFQPEHLSDAEAVAQLRSLAPELIAVAAYGQLLNREILDLPPCGVINVHPSLLPKYRGAAPINWAILNGDRETGVSIMYLAEELDAGDVICVHTTPIDPEENALELTERLAEVGAEALLDAVSRIAAGTVQRKPQDESQVTIAEKLSRELSPIDYSRSSRAICDQIRGLIPWPCAVTELKGRRFKVFRAVPGEPTEALPGTLLHADARGFCMACGDGRCVYLTEVQEDGGKRLSAADYLRGHPLEGGA